MEMPGFTPDHIEQLRQFGVTEAQIVRLTEALPDCATYLLRPAPRNDVRDELESLRAKIECALKAVVRLRNPKTLAAREARARIDEASWFRGVAAFPGAELADVEAALKAAKSVTSGACVRLPKEPRRYASATPEPVRRLYHALLLGWSDDNPAPPPSPTLLDMRPGPRPFPFAPSTSPTSAFWGIVCICYNALLGTKDANPERAIKAFVKAEKADAERRRSIRTNEGLWALGQNVPPKPEVLF